MAAILAQGAQTLDILLAARSLAAPVKIAEVAMVEVVAEVAAVTSAALVVGLWAGITVAFRDRMVQI